jgi:hypothetical protein
MKKQVVVYISELEVKKSEIQGEGVFASKKFDKGEKVFFLTGEEVDFWEINERVEKGLVRPFDPFQISDLRYMDLDYLPNKINHSCNPNCFVKVKNELVALRNISEGEEITYDYSTVMDDNEREMEKIGKKPLTCKCDCGSGNCRKVIDHFRNLPEDVRNHYLGRGFAPYFILNKFQQNL